MNQVFNFNRWLLYTGKHWSENKKKYLLGLAATAALLIIWFSFVMLVDDDRPLNFNLQLTTYHVGLFVIGLFFASLLFNDLSETPRGIHFLMIPASLLEKLLTAILFGLILFFICYTAIFYAIDVIMVNIINSVSTQEMVYGRKYVEHVVNVFTGPSFMQDDYLFIYLILIFVALQTAFMLGSVYFAKYSLIKTAISLLVVFLFFLLLVAVILDAVMPPGHFENSIISYQVVEKGQEQVVMLPPSILEIIYFCFKFGFPPLLVLATWFRLKEKEV
jgi:hypothetical protein